MRHLPFILSRWEPERYVWGGFWRLFMVPDLWQCTSKKEGINKGKKVGADLQGKSHVQILRETHILGHHVGVWPTSTLKEKASHETTPCSSSTITWTTLSLSTIISYQNFVLYILSYVNFYSLMILFHVLFLSNSTFVINLINDENLHKDFDN